MERDIQLKVGKIASRLKRRDDLDSIKRSIAKKLGLSVISNVEILKAYHNFCEKESIKPNKIIENLLIKRRVRSLSGVAVVSVLTKPYPCPGRCLYCPTENGMPKSYLSNEPAVMRAVINKFDPYMQVKTRLEALELTGHPTDKIELIVIGGTWSFLPYKYQNWFIKRCFEACNQFKNQKSPACIPLKAGNMAGRQITNLLNEQKKNEKAKCRIIGITIETRPDFINEKEIIKLRDFGVTRVELGVQSIYDDVLKFNFRGSGRKEIIEATKLLKNAGFKICYHMMPNLPGSDLKRDEEMFKELFYNPDFQPDLLKIYPCAILKEAPIYKLWKQGRYKPYAKQELIEILKKIKKIIPYYVRIQRLIRDIPSQSIVAGPAKISNMRQILEGDSKKENWKCKCIRCREVGRNYNPKEKLFLFRQDYKASGGKEIFLSFESKNREHLYSLLRLKIMCDIGSRTVLPIPGNSVIIRELHTYGKLQSLQHPASQLSPQHKGLGKKLMEEAEKISEKEFGSKKIAVISGVGVRNYYRKLGYKLENTYMVKTLT